MTRGKIRIAGHAVWVLILLGLAFVVTDLQMDRQSAKDPSLALKVPPPFRGDALMTLAIDAYANGNADQGLALSRELLASRPVPAASLSLLVRGLLLKGDPQAALPPLVLAAQRGWRDELTQVLMASSALQVGDTQVAAQRLVALWRQNLQDYSPQMMPLTESLLQRKDGAQAFSSVILGTDDWAADFLVWAASADIPSDDLRTLATTIASKHIAVDCQSLWDPLRKVAITGGAKAVGYVWSQLCAQGPVTAVSDFTFKASQDADSPIDWNLPANAGLDSQIEQNGGSADLLYKNEDHHTVVVAQHVMALAAGRHTIRITGGLGYDADSRLPVVQVLCYARDGSFSSVVRSMPDNGLVTFEIPQTQCDGQDLVLSSRDGKGLIRQVVVDGG